MARDDIFYQVCQHKKMERLMFEILRDRVREIFGDDDLAVDYDYKDEELIVYGSGCLDPDLVQIRRLGAKSLKVVSSGEVQYIRLFPGG